MNTQIVDILNAAKQYQVEISVNGSRLQLSAPEKPPEEFLQTLRVFKPQIIQALTASPFPAWSFVLDGYTKIYAIRLGGASKVELEYQLVKQFGPDRVSEITALQIK